MFRLPEIKEALLHFLFPHCCCGCGSDRLSRHSHLCMRCLHDLPATGFERLSPNPVERVFYGRLPLSAAAAAYYFNKESLVQRLMHEFKYRGNRELGLQLGRLMGEQLYRSGRFEADLLIPLPLYPAKEKKRGFNQAQVLCEGIAAVTHIPVLKNAVCRTTHTETQTKKGRIERWQNMEGKFRVTDPGSICNKQLMLVDDVVTTGATLEACGQELLQVRGTKLMLATLCVASRY